MEPVLSLRNLGFSRWYGHGRDRRSRVIFKDLNLDVGHGDRIALIGSNGTGKSTLLRLMSGILEPDEGAVVRNVSQRVILNPSVGFDSVLTGRENIRTLLILQGLSEDEIKTQLEEVIVFSELGNFIDEAAKTYSAGMISRLVIGTQLIGIGHSGLLIDEGIGTADVKFQLKVLASLEERIQTLPYLVLASHDASMLTRFCQRGVVLETGKVAFDGPLNDALSFYDAARRVAP